MNIMNWTEVTIGLFTLIGIIITARYTFLANRSTLENIEISEVINEAVNHRGTGETLYDMVFQVLREVMHLSNKQVAIDYTLKTTCETLQRIDLEMSKVKTAINSCDHKECPLKNEDMV